MIQKLLCVTLFCLLTQILGQDDTIYGDIEAICEELSETECLPDQCLWLETACICLDDTANIDVWFLLDSSNISQEIWEYLMIQLPSDYIETVQSDLTNVYVARFGDFTFELLTNPSINELNSWEYIDKQSSTVCDALNKLESYLIESKKSQRTSMVITIFANEINDGPNCNTQSLSADIVYGVSDNLYENEYSFLNYNGVCLMDISLISTDSTTITFMSNYVLSVISDFACILEPIIPTPQPVPVINEPTYAPSQPSITYVGYVNYVYKKIKPKRIGNGGYGVPIGHGHGHGKHWGKGDIGEFSGYGGYGPYGRDNGGNGWYSRL